MLQTLKGHSSNISSIKAIAFLLDSKLLASIAGDRVIRLWEIGWGGVLQILKGYSRSVNTVAFLSNSKLLALASDNKAVRLWDTGLSIML